MEVNGSEVALSVKRGSCARHGGYEYYASPLLSVDRCPACMKERLDEIERERAEKDERERAERRSNAAHLRDMGIEPKFFNADLSTFEPEEGEPMRSLQSAALEAVRRLVERRRGFVILMGGHGTRKTTLGCAALRDYGDGLITSIYEASFLMRAGRMDGVETGFSRLARLAETPLLVLDEIGRTNCSDYERNWMSYVIDKRESRELPTMLISNYPLREIAPQGYRGVVLDDIFGTDVLSRLSRAKKLRVSGTDFRTLGDREE